LASFDGNVLHASTNILGGLLYVMLALLVLRPLLSRWQKSIFLSALGVDSERVGEVGVMRLTEAGLVVALALMALGAWFTDRIGLHAVFGAFLMGAALPRGAVVRDVITRVQPVAVALLLPLFFTYSGLNTRIGLLNSFYLWLMGSLVMIAAVLGKGVACWLAARATGLPNREALGIGTLMNSRGLMELIIINIGLQRGVISEELFAILVIMAVVTTLMASPLFDWLVPGQRVKATEFDEGLAS
jgi:Kef-type K+ transport system membrane component KefB